ncbi:DUF986 family protein [Tatumella sp. UCD-D_suzukii]|uniref:DUF986 family protein n=1 Tax=Tatumella sp. UCD-D_suzukii TaxID=1408192 RepID=UPI00046ED02E|nr:DUF986 family protein [Tatumella sp. UCD-D_suzukii]
MSLTDAVILLFTVCLMCWLLFEQVVTGWLKGKTLLRISLLRAKATDGMIFIVLVAILLYNNAVSAGSPLTSWLLSLLLLCGIYLVWLRRPLLLLKPEGLWYGAIYISYARIQQLNLSDDGVLVLGLGARNLLIRVRDIDSLEQIYQTLSTLRA